MKIFFKNQYKNLGQHLNGLKKSSVMVYNIEDCIEKTSTIEIETQKKISEIDLSFIFNYSIFPSPILIYRTQWSEEKREMSVGDYIVQQVFLPPFYVSMKMIFGVRINAIINETNKIGFSYEALEGHVEKGISIFTIENDNERIIFKIKTYSAGGNMLTRLLGYFFAIPYQTYCTKLALKNVKRQIESQV